LSRAAAGVAAAAAFATAIWASIDPAHEGLSLLLLAFALLAAGVAWLNGVPDSAKELALIATLAAAAAAGRVLFAAIPGVQPITVMTVVAGIALGARSGFAVGAIAAFVSNFFLGQGVWTPWQMLAWGACGVVGGLLPKALGGRFALAGVCFVVGLGFSLFMDVWEWYAFFPHTWAALTLQIARGFPFDMAHAVGNVILALAAGPELRRVLERYERRTRVEIAWA
jgi:energy-coupling factor transport system substrate-specific component